MAIIKVVLSSQEILQAISRHVKTLYPGFDSGEVRVFDSSGEHLDSFDDYAEVEVLQHTDPSGG